MKHAGWLHKTACSARTPCVVARIVWRSEPSRRQVGGASVHDEIQFKTQFLKTLKHRNNPRNLTGSPIQLYDYNQSSLSHSASAASATSSSSSSCISCISCIACFSCISCFSIAASMASRPGPAHTSPPLALALASHQATCTCAAVIASTASCRLRADLLRIHCNRTSIEVRDSVGSRIKCCSSYPLIGLLKYGQVRLLDPLVFFFKLYGGDLGGHMHMRHQRC